MQKTIPHFSRFSGIFFCLMVFLVCNTSQASAVLEIQVSEKTDFPVSVDTEKWPKRFTDTWWQFGNPAVGVYGKAVRLLPGGIIERYSHPNESRWGVEQGAVVFYHSSDKPSCRFTKIVEEQGKTVMSGPFLLNDSGAYHELRQTDPPGLENIQIRLGNRHTATGPDGIALFDDLAPGEYPLVIDHPGFYHYEQRVTLPSLQKKHINITLTSVIRADYQGVMQWKTRPVPGAKITFTPLYTKLTRNSPRTITSDFTGGFILRELPLGKYQMAVNAPGFAPQKREILHNGGLEKPQVFELAAPVIEKKERLEVRVQDALTSKAVAGAAVVLAEAGKTGIVQEKTTNAAGRVLFENIATGYRNLVLENRLELSRPQLSVSVDAEKYAPQLVPLTLPNTRITVALSPTIEIAEQEPNNDAATAQKIIPGLIIATRIAEVGDQDFFTFRLEYPAKLTIATTEASPLENCFRLMDENGKELAGRCANKNSGNNVIARGLPAGHYLLQVEEWGNNGMSDTPIRFQITAENAPDALEPNDSRQQARFIAIGQEVRAAILPIGDQDWFRFRVDRPGRLRLIMPAVPFERYLNLFQGSAEKPLQGYGISANNELRREIDLIPGEYFIQITEWGNNNESMEPYSLRLDYLEDDGIDDPPADKLPIRPIRTLARDGFATSSILPVGDLHLYQIKIPSAGRLQIWGKSALELYLSLRDKQGKALSERGSGAHSENHISYDSDGSQTLNLLVMEWGNNNAGTELYRLKSLWQPADDNDQRQRNDEPGKATLIKPGARLRHTIFPLKDIDFYRLSVDHPGYLQVKGKSPVELYLRWLDETEKIVGERGFGANGASDLTVLVPAGAYFLQVEEWGNNNSSIQPYDLEVLHQRIEPEEKNLDNTNPPRPLHKGVAQSFVIDWNQDVDQFRYQVKAGEELFVSIKNPIESYITVIDARQNKVLFEKGFGARQKITFPLKVEKDTELDLRIIEWGQNNHSAIPGLIIVDSKEHDLPLPPVLRGIPCGEAPGTTCFTVEAIKDQPLPKKITVDTNLDGRFDLAVDPEQGAEYRFAKPGIYQVAAEMLWRGEGGESIARTNIWADSRLTGKQIGMELSLDGLKDKELVEEARPVTFFATPSSGARLSRIVCTLDGKPLATLHTPPFSVEIPWLQLGAGSHRLQATSFDSRGKSKSIERTFSLSPYFGLRPEDGARITGENVRITWSGSTFGPAAVQYREKGSTKWQKVYGDSGRLRSVLLRGLTAGKVYEYQAISGKKPSEIREVYLLKGLAFGRSDYGANIKRDYNQRVGISVRNNGDKQLQVRLVCGKPADPLLLVGFVGEGSEDKPFTLQPKEERQFMLGISAQDVNTADHSFPVKIIAENGLADEAMVNLHVRLPVIQLVWQKMGEAKYGLGQKYRIVNKGDTVTDLAISNSKNTFYSVPAINHGLLPAGGHTDITVYPRLYSGFTQAEDTLVARGMGKNFAHKIQVKLPKGEKLFQNWLIPGLDPQQDAAEYRQCLDNLKKAAILDPEKIDWSGREAPEDLDGDGKADRWQLFDTTGDVLWMGDDSDGDGEIDFVHADQGMDGVFEFSAFRREKGWQRTNLVEAWLEMGFSLPWSTTSYKPHDVDIVFNDEVIGVLRDTIPDGNYSFRIPPHLVRFNSQGMPEGNKVGINTKHLRGGHYVVNSDYRFTFRLTATPVWSTGKTEQEAFARALEIDGLSLNAPDYSVSSADMRLIGPEPDKLEPGMALEIEGKIHNLGAVSLPVVPVALFDTRPGKSEEEVARIELTEIPMNGKKSFRFPWQSRGGQHTLKMVVDPEKILGDADYSNNTANLLITIAGDDEPPDLQLVAPVENSKLARPVTEIVAQANDLQGLSTVEASVDGGLWQKLMERGGGKYSGRMLVQPGKHLLRVRATDLSGNITEKEAKLSFSAEKPAVELVFPHDNDKIKARNTKVMLKTDNRTVGAAARIDGGPWYGAKITGGFARTKVPLRYGEQHLEVMLVREDGIVGSKEITITCTRKAEQSKQESFDAGEHALIPVQGLGRIPLFGEWNLVVGE